MCGIVGFFNEPQADMKLKKALEILKERGRDSYGVCGYERIQVESRIKDLEIPPEENLLGHCLHAIVGEIPQPLEGKGRLVSNCEIYNWKELNEKYDLGAQNDSHMLLKLIELKGPDNFAQVLGELRGTYAFAYWLGDHVYLARDIIGLKPLWYSHDNGFALASEKKALSFEKDVKELNPREILKYNIKTRKITKIERGFFSITPEIHDYPETKKALKELLFEAINIRIPNKRFGLLFSGGVDSTTIALILKKMGTDFTCYVAALSQEAEDVKYAKMVARSLGLELKIKIVPLNMLVGYIKKVVPLIEDSNVVKVGVALPFFAACEMAKEDGCKVIFSGMGADELFAGYNRYKKSPDVNKDLLSDILKMYERNTYRDDVITMYHSLELRVPFLDRELVDFSLKIPAGFKIKGETDKAILRELSLDLGIPLEIAFRKKRAAQYGSRFDYGLKKLAKKAGKTKSEFLRDFRQEPNVRLGVLFSSGKDSTFAMDIMMRQNYSIECLITIKSKNPESYMFHTPNIDLVRLQAKAMGIPLVMKETPGLKEDELKDLEDAIISAKEKYQIQGVVTGALYSNYQRERIERICDRAGLKIFSPLWHMDQEEEMMQILKRGYEFILSSVASYGLDKSWLGKKINESHVFQLVKLHEKYGINIAGEGGEFESLVINGPLFEKPINIEEYEIIEENENTAFLKIKKAVLGGKDE